MLSCSDLTKSYDGFQFGPVDLAVDDEVLAVLGPSGSGKTTLLSLIAGIVRPDGGSVSLAGRSLDGLPPEARNTGLVFQEGALFPHMTARQNVAYAASAPERVDDLADLLEVRDVLDRRPAALSGGERQRIALARTLAADPDAVLLDEPLSSLDAPIRRRLREELHDLFASLSVPVVYVTHDQRTATALGDRVAVFRDGAVEQVGPPGTVRDCPATPFVARFTGTENVLDATVVERTDDGFGGGETVVRVGDVTLRATDGDGSSSVVDDGSVTAAGRPVTACVHPSRVVLHGWDGEDGPRGENAIHGTVTRALDEGASCRVRVDADDAPVTVTATVRPPTAERLGVERGARVVVEVPPHAVHLLGRSREDDL